MELVYCFETFLHFYSIVLSHMEYEEYGYIKRLLLLLLLLLFILMLHRACYLTCFTIKLMHYLHFKIHPL
jgi:hypothetical protein